MRRTPENPAEREGFGKSKTPESKEAEKLSPVFLIYRDNAMFKEFIPQVAETLKSLGHQVEIQNFPVGSGEEEMKEWYEENKEKLEGKELIGDGSFTFTLREELKGKIEKQKIDADYLDSLSDKIYTETAIRKVLGEKEAKKIKERGIDYNKMEVLDKAYPALIKWILKNPKNLPKKAYIHYTLASAHKPFREIGDGNESDREAAKKIKDWLIKGGIPAESINFIGDPEKATDKEYRVADKADNWIVTDRHSRNVQGLNESEWEEHLAQYKDYRIKHPSTHNITTMPIIRLAKILELPISSFFKAAEKQGMIEVDNEEFKKVLEEMLKKDFGEETEE